MKIGFKFDSVGMPQKATDVLMSGLIGTISWVRLFNDSLRLSGDIKPTERVDAFSISDNGIAYSVVAASGVTVPSSPERGNALICRGSWLLRTACGHCSRCQEEAPKAIAALQKSSEKNERALLSIRGCIPPSVPIPGYDLTDAVKAKLFDAAREQLYDEEGQR